MTEANTTESTDRSTLEGTAPDLTDAVMRAKAMEAAFDYRGDVTIETDEGRSLEGYVFNRKADVDEPYVELMLASGGKEKVRYAQVKRLSFTGRDTAAGKSFDTWIKKYVEKKLRGEAANIEAEEI